MRRVVLGVLLSHWWRNPLQLLILLVGLALATGLWSAVQAINAEARASYAKAAQQMVSASMMDRIEPIEGQFLPLQSYAALRRAGWQVVAALDGRVELNGRMERVLGVDLLSYPTSDFAPLFPRSEPETPSGLGRQIAGDDERIDGREPLAGVGQTPQGVSAYEVLINPGRAFATQEMADRLSFDAIISTPTPAPAPKSGHQTGAQNLYPGLPPIVISPSAPANVILMDIGWAQKVLGLDAVVTHMLVLPDQLAGLPAIKDVIPNAKRVRMRAGAGADLARLTDSFHLNLTAFGFLAFGVGVFIVHGTIGLAFEQRRTMVRNLRALGVSGRDVVFLMIAEVFALALIGAILGIGVGYGVAAALLPDVAATLQGLYGADVSNVLTLRRDWVVAGFAMTFMGAFGAAAQALWRILQMPLLASSQSRAWGVRTGRADKMQLVVGSGLLVCGVCAPVLADGLLAGFTLLGALFLGAALVLPSLLAVLLSTAQRMAKAAFSQWLWADTRAQLPAVSLALAALLLALAANVGVGTMVGSFRATFVGWLDQRLAAELYITVQTPEQARALRNQLREMDMVRAVLPVRSIDLAKAQGSPSRIVGVVDHATYRQHWPMIDAVPEVWDILALGRGVLINEQLARRLNVWSGDEIDISGTLVQVTLGQQTDNQQTDNQQTDSQQSNGQTLFSVIGVYSDYGNPNGQMMLGAQLFDDLFPDHPPALSFGVRVARSDMDAVIYHLDSSNILPAGAIQSGAAIKRLSLRIFDKTFLITGALNVLTLGVAGFAMTTALLTLQTSRLPLLAPIWAMGVTRRALATTELLRNLALAGVTAILAVPLGLVLAWILLNVINVHAFGWRLPVILFPLDWVRLIALAIGVACLAAAWPAWRLWRSPVSELLKVFSSER
jgi:putative ABC transport system permease protein